MPLARNGDVEIYYDVHGDDPEAPVLMLVGGLGEQIGSVEFPREQVQLFVDAGFRVVPVDCRDAGLSTSFDAAGRPDIDAILTSLFAGEAPSVPYTHHEMSDDLIAVADDIGVAKVHLVGASAGGFVVRWAAVRHPDRVATVTVVMSGSGAFADDDGPQLDLSGFDGLLAEGDHRTAEDHLAHTVELWRELWSTAFPFDEAWIRRRVIESFERSYRPDGIMRQLAAGMGTAGLWDAQHTLAQPMLVLHGTADTTFGPDHGAGTAARVPNAELWLVDGMGHSMPSEIWDEMTERISILTSVS